MRRTSDAVTLYLDKIAKIPLLSTDQEIILGRQVAAWMAIKDTTEELTPDQIRIKRCGLRAHRKMFEANLRLVVMLGKKYFQMCQNLELNDLIQEGNFGLMRAVDKFDPERGYKFSTYAYWWIRQAITRAINQQDSTIRTPTGHYEQLYKIRAYCRKFEQINQRSATQAEICEEFRIDPKHLNHMRNLAQGCMSLNQSPTEDGGCLIDLIPSDGPNDEEIIREMSHQDLLYDLKPIMQNKLSNKEQEVIQLRFFNQSKTKVATFTDVAKTMGLSRERIRQHEAIALMKLSVACRHRAIA